MHPVAFHSRKLSPTEINYEIHDKELLAIVDSFREWRRHLESATHKVQVYSDHHNLTHFTTTKVLNRRQARWAQEIASIDFIVHFRPGKNNSKPDILSRRSEYRPEKGGSEYQPVKTVLQDKHFAPASLASWFLISSARLGSIPSQNWNEDFVKRVQVAAKDDPEYQERFQHPTDGDAVVDGLIYHTQRLWVPQESSICKDIFASENDTKVAVHMGQAKTIELVSRNFWWLNVKQDVISYVEGCLDCQKNMAPRRAPYGKLQPLELPYAPWRSISMDFIADLPISHNCDQLWVVIDRFTKMAHFIPLKTGKQTAAHLIRIVTREFWRLRGVPLSIVLDRGSRLTLKIWSDLQKLLEIEPRMSTAFHPQTEGQTERTNPTLEAYLRAFVNQEMDNWVDLLPLAEFAYNNAFAAATRKSRVSSGCQQSSHSCRQKLS